MAPAAEHSERHRTGVFDRLPDVPVAQRHLHRVHVVAGLAARRAQEVAGALEKTTEPSALTLYGFFYYIEKENFLDSTIQ